MIALDTEKPNPTHTDHGLESAIITTGRTITVNGASDVAHGELDSPYQLELTFTPTATRAIRQAQLEAAAKIIDEARRNDPESYARASPNTALDPLTGLYNRGTFASIAKTRIAEALRNGESVTVIVFDYQSFKPVNDTYGHLVGDKVLATGAKAIKDTLRECDIVGRIGGDEYMAVLPNANEQDALLIEQRIAQAISKHPVNINNGKALEYRVDTGFSVMNPDTGYDLETHKEKADQAMYENKKASKKNSNAA